MQEIGLLLILVGILWMFRGVFDKDVGLSKPTMDETRRYSREHPEEIHLKAWLDSQKEK